MATPSRDRAADYVDEARREAVSLYERVPESERSWCAEDLADLRRTAPAAKVA